MGFSRQEYCSGLPFPCAEDLPNPEIEHVSPALQADSLPLSHLRSPDTFRSFIFKGKYLGFFSIMNWLSNCGNKTYKKNNHCLFNSNLLHFSYSHCSQKKKKKVPLPSPIVRRRQWHPTPVLLPGKSCGWRSLVGCSPWGREESDKTSDFTFMHWRRKWQPTPVFLHGESQGRGSLVGCRLWGRTESDTTEVS